MNKTYAGIGSRETPHDVRVLMAKAASALYDHGYILRTGGAAGADAAFLSGAPYNAEVYLPWPGFTPQDGSACAFTGTGREAPTGEAHSIAAKHHPAWNRLSQGAKKLHARNVHQVLGANCDTPVHFVLCWTPGAQGGGGTGQAIRIAKAHGIPVFDLADTSVRERIERMVRSHEAYIEDRDRSQADEIRAETNIPQHLVW